MKYIPLPIFVTLKRNLLAIVGVFYSISAFSQVGGNGVFAILRQPTSARLAAWGGSCVSFQSTDVNLFLSNPALLGDAMANRVSMNVNTQFKGVWSGNGAYVYKYKNKGYFGIGFGYINYGTMNAYDEGGNSQGTTSANESMLCLSYGNRWNSRITYGVSLKMAYSVLGPYIGNGVVADAGATYSSKDSLYSVGLVLRNAGFMIASYGGGPREKMPFNADIGITFKPKHMPIRFNIVAHDLQKWDLTYDQYLANTGSIDLSGNKESAKEASFGVKLMRHINVGAELVLGNNFSVLLGYNHQRRSEMGPDVRKGLSGFCWGLNFKVSKFQITYGGASYFPGYKTNLFTLTALLSDFKRK